MLNFAVMGSIAAATVHWACALVAGGLVWFEAFEELAPQAASVNTVNTTEVRTRKRSFELGLIGHHHTAEAMAPSVAQAARALALVPSHGVGCTFTSSLTPQQKPWLRSPAERMG